MKIDYDQKKTEFLAWLLMPEAERLERGYPTTQLALAARLGVNDSTLSDWKARPDFRTNFVREGWLVGIVDELPKVFRALSKSAQQEGKDGARDRATLMRTLEPYLPQLLGLDLKPALDANYLEKARERLDSAEYAELVEMSARLGRLLAKLEDEDDNPVS